MSQFFTSGGQYWSFSFSINPSNEYSGLISFRIDQLDLLAVQGTLKSLPQYQSSKASILQCSAFFMVQLSNPSLHIAANSLRISILHLVQFSSVQFSSVAQSCLTLCNPVECSTSGLPVHHQIPEFTQIHIH